MQEQKNEKISRVFYIVALIPFVIGLIGCIIFNLNKNKVSAASSPEGVAYSPYSICIGNIYSFDYSLSSASLPHPYLVPTNDICLSFYTYTDKLVCVDISYLQYSGTTTAEYYTSYLADNGTNSIRYKYAKTLPDIDFISTDTNEFYSLDVYVEVNINKIISETVTTTPESLYNYTSKLRKTTYISTNTGVKTLCNRIAFLDASDTEFCTVYFYVPLIKDNILITSTPNSLNFDFIPLKIDRSAYVRTDIVITDGMTNMFDTIKNGMSRFFNIKIYKEFTVGSCLLVVFGVSFFSFLIHLLIK